MRQERTIQPRSSYAGALVKPCCCDALISAKGFGWREHPFGVGVRLRRGGYRIGEGFRVPLGVRKPLMQERADHRRWLWGISIFC